MKNREFETLDGNEAVARVAYKVNEVIAIYPITPSSPMGEWADAYTAVDQKNIWGTTPLVMEMQSEGGAAGAVHGALQTGSLTTTFTASQGLLLMIPNMYKIAGELTPTVFHIAARSVATSALSIFGDHSDVMACRQTGWGMLAAGSVQEAHDMALISTAASLNSRIPFLHFFDGFRTSHEVSKIELMDDEDIKALIDEAKVIEHRSRALSPDHPVIRGTAQNPDTFFQGREAVNPYYERCANLVEAAMDKFANVVGRQYKPFDYVGAPDASRVIVLMGSGAETAHETVEFLEAQGEKVGIVKVRLYRPFDMNRFVNSLPATTESIAVLDRTKEPGSADPMYLDVINALHEVGGERFKKMPKVVGGRYGLSSKEFTPAMVKAVFDNLSQAKPKNHFTIGINDDLTHTSLTWDKDWSTEPKDVVRAMFFGLGADGTVGANKESIKIIGTETNNFAQGYFVYDSKKSGAMTVSHLRFGPRVIRSQYLISTANFVACHQPVFVEKLDLLSEIGKGGTFLLNTPHGADQVWEHLPKKTQQRIIDKGLKFYVIDATALARDVGLGGRINTVMQACFFALSGVLPRDEAVEQIKKATKKAYGKKGDQVVNQNIEAIDRSVAAMHEVKVPASVTSATDLRPPVPAEAPEFVRNVLGEVIAGRGNDLPTSKVPVDGTYPTGTAKWERRNIALEIPTWNSETCIQCGKCVMVCPHAVIRAKAYEPKALENAPATFRSADSKVPEWKGLKFTIQVAPEDCTGCSVCTDACPLKNKPEEQRALLMRPQLPLREQEATNLEFFRALPNVKRTDLEPSKLRHLQVMEPLFEYSGACAGCGSAPYLRVVSQLFGDRALIANATGCTSIYCGNMPTTPWTTDANGRGPAWANSLFEDNAEFGIGFSLSVQKQTEFALELAQRLAPQIGDSLVKEITDAEQSTEAGLTKQRERVATLKQKLFSMNTPEAKQLLGVADMLVRKSIWIFGGDGWAYDIGYGGLDHALASGRNINILVVDTEAYSNTGGQMSKSTPRGAVAKFATNGKPACKKDLGMMAMSYRNVYVASVAMGAKDDHTLKTLLEAESYPGVSIVIAYSPCIIHGIDMGKMLQHQKSAVDCGSWLLYRYDPRRADKGENPLQLDCKDPSLAVEEHLYKETRFSMLRKANPERAAMLLELAKGDISSRWAYYKNLASLEQTKS